MKAKLLYIWELLKTSFWFVPLNIVLFAITLSFGLTWLDSLLEYEPSGFFLYFYTGGAESARSILSTVAAAMLGVASIYFPLPWWPYPSLHLSSDHDLYVTSCTTV